MRARIYLPVLILALWVPGFKGGCQDRRGLLWEISGNNLESPSYIFGTIHLLCPSELSISDSVNYAISHTEQVVLEIDFNDSSIPGKIRRGMKMSGSDRIRNYLNNDEFGLVKDFFRDSLHIPFRSVNNVKPMFLITLIIPKIKNCPASSLETKLTGLAALYHRRIIGLENVEDQIRYINNVNLREQSRMLFESIDHYDSTRIEYLSMVDLYREERIDELFRYIKEKNSGFDGITRTLVYDRNRNWLSKIVRIISERPSFIAVGAGHLGGDQGIISLLQEQGYALRPVD